MLSFVNNNLPGGPVISLVVSGKRFVCDGRIWKNRFLRNFFFDIDRLELLLFRISAI